MFLLLVGISKAFSQPELTRIETEVPSTGNGPYLRSLTDLDGKVYFPYNNKMIEVNDDYQTREITLSNSIGSPQNINSIVALGDKLLINNYHFNLYHYEPGLLNPMTGEVELLKDINPSGHSYPNQLYSTGEKAYFQAYDGTEYAIWSTDGNEENTKKIISLDSDCNPRYFQYNGVLYISINGTSSSNAFWVTDGTKEGTKKLTDNSNYDYGYATTASDNYFYFVVRGSDSFYQLFQSDGTTAGTKMVIESTSTYYYSQMFVFKIDEKIFYSFYGYDGLTRIFHLDENTLQANEVIQLSYSISNLNSDGNQAYFIKNGDERGIWRTNGTQAGTFLVKAFEEYETLYTNLSTTFNNKFFVSMYSPDTGGEPWISDGTIAGTKQLKDIYPGPFPSMASTYSVFFSEALDVLFFNASTPTTGNEVWITDGTESGTFLLKDFNTLRQNLSMFKIVATEKKLYAQTSYFNYESPNLFELSLGGNQLKSSLEQERATFATQTAMAGFKNDIYFNGYPINDDGTYPYALYRLSSDESIEPVKGYLYSYGLTEIDNKLFFAGSAGQGYELWVSEDGSSEGTYQVADIAPGSYSSMETSPTNELPIVYFGGKYFFAANNNISGRELWVTDLTEAGTELFFDLEPGNDWSEPRNFFVAGDKLYFTANSDGNAKLWVTDGTSENTAIVADIETDLLFYVGSQVYFLEEYNYRYYKLWKTDGTVEGTEEIRDLGYFYNTVPAIQFDEGFVYCDYNGSSYDYYLIDNEGADTKFKSSTGQIIGLTTKDNYVYYTVGSEMRITNGSDIDDKVIDLYDAAYLQTNSSNKFYTIFGEDLIFYSYDYEEYAYSLWKLNLFKPVASIIYDSDPLESGETINFGTLSEGNQSGIETVTIENGGFVDWSFPQGSTLAVMGDAAKDFIIVSGSLPSMLRPGESFDIDIRFKPTTGDVREAYIELPALAGSGSPGIVNLEGVGTNFEQTIKLQVPSKILYKNTPIALDIEATSGLPVTLSSSDKTVAEFVDGNLVTKKFGTITITATQGGNAYFHAADPATKEVDIVVGGQSIAFNSANTYRIDDDPFELSATSTSGNPVTFASGDATVLSISGTTATILKAGVVSVTASV
ncbi:MAG: hypothetical protein RIG68_05880, partial [Imperialibacter sp.]|uniref:hypothetical protein n=1 Tax=Imperialibacter sp. TaxID=2038411 RepID=UPI0032ED35C2